MTHWQWTAVNTMTSHTADRAARQTNQSGGNMVLRSGRTTEQKRQLTNGSKVNQHLPFVCTCFNSNGKQRKEMIARAIGVRAFFCPGGGGGAAVNHLPKKFLQVTQILRNSRKETRVIRCTNNSLHMK